MILFVVVLFFSFHKRLHFWKDIRYMAPALLLSGALWFLFERRMAELALWTYHLRFLSNCFVAGLPLERWIFLLVFPLTGFLLYRIASGIPWLKGNANYFVILSLALMALFTGVTLSNRAVIYPFVIFLFLTVYLGYVIFRGRFKPHYSAFYVSFLVLLIPFFSIQSIARGLPVMTYVEKYMLGISLFRIPVEDIAAFFLLFLMNISIYEYLSDKKFY
jgi:hypothetical protein